MTQYTTVHKLHQDGKSACQFGSVIKWLMRGRRRTVECCVKLDQTSGATYTALGAMAHLVIYPRNKKDENSLIDDGISDNFIL